MRGGAHPAIRTDDGRTARPERAQREIFGRLLDRLVDAGRFHPALKDIEWAAGRARSFVSYRFGGRRLLMAHLARLAPARVVDAIGLSPEARYALSPRDEKAIAMAVLAGRKLEAGE
jgi:hypothetical protein